MPHLIVEYTDNLDAETDIKALLSAANAVLIAQIGEGGRPIFPIGGIRARAVKLTHYVVADGAEADDAFVHTTLKVGAGRGADALKKTGDELFAAIEAHFEPLLARRQLALSLEIQEFGEAGTWKRNDIHARYKK